MKMSICYCSALLPNEIFFKGYELLCKYAGTMVMLVLGVLLN